LPAKIVLAQNRHGGVCMLVLMVMSGLVAMFVTLTIAMLIMMIMAMTVPMLFILAPYIDFRRRNSAAVHPRNLQLRANIQRRNRIFQQARGHTRIHQRAQKHVAADAGKTV
jgi:hypothetical protein